MRTSSKGSSVGDDGALSTDLQLAMASLAARRPIFHSEADFQHALAWELHQRWPGNAMRLEYKPPAASSRMYIDIWVTTPSGAVAIELKYKTRRLHVTVAGESFALLDQSAQDIGRYDFLKDVQRLEEVVLDRQDVRGYAILVTNDRAYWSPATGRVTVDASFRLHDGRDLSGQLGWGAGTSAGTMRGREVAIGLRRPYRLAWRDYSRVTSSTYGTFRYLLVGVGAASVTP
jgi:hypothetical protein